MTPGRLDGRVALVTGSSTGIGAGVAKALAEQGARVVVTSRSSVQAGEAIAEEIGGIYRQADVADPDDARALVAAVGDEYGRLDILVNNAGTTRAIPHRDLDSATPEIWAEIYATNVIAPFVLTTAAAPFLRAAPESGVIVNVGSLAGIRPGGSSIPYAASKAALHHQTRLLAAAPWPEIGVNAVAPRVVDVRWTSGWHNLKAKQWGLRPCTGRSCLVCAGVMCVVGWGLECWLLRWFVVVSGCCVLAEGG
jgi:NAD(P)-dependent dehydrogenase (short-subunit alcohol dehydrogenase family)